MSTPPPPPAPSSAGAGPGPAAPARLRSVNCTQCGAPITLRGGHKVLSITCGYCGSELDAKHEYRLIRKFSDRDRPLTPIELGMTGRFHGVEFTVIALVQYRTRDGYGWLELALFSPTHGYAWLEQVDNHFLFSRRTRDLPATPIGTRIKSTFKVRDRTYEVYERYHASVVYVEGELPFVAEAGDEVQVTEAISPPYIYSVERTAAEEEYVLGEYLEPEAVYRALGLENEPSRRRTVHPAQPYQPSPKVTALSRAAGFFLPAAALLLLAAALLGTGNRVLDARFDARAIAAGSQAVPFEIADAGRLLELEVRAGGRNPRLAYDVQVHRGDAPVFSMAEHVARHAGLGSASARGWSRGSREASTYFKLPAPGRYSLVVATQAGAGPVPTGSGPVEVTVTEGIIVTRYFVILVVLCALGLAVRYLARWRFESRRWGISMSKLFIAVFGALTLGAGYLTMNDVGVMEPSIQKASVRTGSAHRRTGGFFGGYRGGK